MYILFFSRLTSKDRVFFWSSEDQKIYPKYDSSTQNEVKRSLKSVEIAYTDYSIGRIYFV